MKKIIILISIFIQISYSQNTALSFDGTDDYVTTSLNINHTYTAFTVEAWINYNSTTNQTNILGQSGTIEIAFIDSKLNVWINTNGAWFNFFYTIDGSFPSNTWNHIAITGEGSIQSNQKIYINGILKVTTTGNWANLSNPGHTFKMGGNTQSPVVYYSGKMDEVRVWNVARTQAQIKSAMYDLDPTTTGLVAYYKFNDGSGTTLTNSVSGGASGTLTNSPTWVSSPVKSVANALHFDGTSDEVLIGDANSLDLANSLTIEAWLYPTNTSSLTQSVVSKSNITSNTGYVFPRTDAAWDSFDCYLYINGSWRIVTYNPSTTLTNSWHHYACTYDGSTIKLYFDGNLVSTLNFSGSVTTNANQLCVGRQPGYNTEWFTGSIDEIRIWNVARTASEIANNYNKEIPITTSGLVAYYSFNQGIASGTNTGLATLIDNASTNNGTLTGFTLSGSTSNYVSQNGSITTDASTLLPVELKNFTARTQNNNVILNWKTITETNNSGFEVEKSTRHTTQASVLRNWDKIGFVRGSGTSSVEKNYNYSDNNLRSGKYSYRLKQIDLDGTTEYSQVKEVEVGNKNRKLSTNPNPFNSTTIINFEIEEKTEVSIKLYDLLGRVVAEIVTNELKEVGEHEVKFNANHLTSGVYLLKFQTNKFNAIEKLVLMK